MASPKRIVMEQAAKHESFQRAQFMILLLGVVTSAIYVIVSVMSDIEDGGDASTNSKLFQLVVSLAVLGLVMLLINYYHSSTRTLYVLKILAHLGAVGLVIAASIEMSNLFGDETAAADNRFNTIMHTFGALTVGLIGLGTLIGIINASHEFAFLV